MGLLLTQYVNLKVRQQCPSALDFLFSHCFTNPTAAFTSEHPVSLLQINMGGIGIRRPDRYSYTTPTSHALTFPAKLGVILSLPHSELPRMEGGATCLAS